MGDVTMCVRIYTLDDKRDSDMDTDTGTKSGE
jgi:hypothetical protein